MMLPLRITCISCPGRSERPSRISLGITTWYFGETRVFAIRHLLCGIDRHIVARRVPANFTLKLVRPKLTIALYVGPQKQPMKESEVAPTEAGLRQLVRWIKELKGPVHRVYEAGPCGYQLYRLLASKKIDCVVAAPSLTPRKPGERIKTNRRDAQKLAELHRAGMLTLITIPDRRQESVRDLLREDRPRSLHRGPRGPAWPRI